MAETSVDVLIVGAGLSGIAAAYYLQKQCPTLTYAILEARAAIGGTWDLFRYPGIRSDSDMYTLGYSFRPWRGERGIADGPAIRAYIRETAAAFGIDRKIRFGHQVVRAAWSSEAARWTVEARQKAEGDRQTAGQGLAASDAAAAANPAPTAAASPSTAQADRVSAEPVRFTCRFLFLCTGYYDYAAGYMPEWPGLERFAGRIVHPQQWPEALDYGGKRVLVIGSGATAVTLVPAMAQRAAHVTMLQRSPSYVMALPAQDPVVGWLRRHLPAGLAFRAARWKAILLTSYFYAVSRRRPAAVKRMLVELVRKELGPGYDVGTHFTPRYNPWDQRLCFVPDGDLFGAIRSGRASVVTDQIERFTESGVRLRSGQELAADIVVAATGLVLKLMGGMALSVDGRPVDLAQALSYKGMMFSDVPNLALAIGYTNASWTLKCELTAAYVCRLLNHMARHGYARCAPRRTDPRLGERPILDFTSGYVQRALPDLPRQGDRRPWRLYQNYFLDLISLRLGRVDDAAMEFRS